jgi:hypothetical protein
MVCTGISYGQQTQLHFIDGNLNTQRHREILMAIVVPFIFWHHLIFQHDNKSTFEDVQDGANGDGSSASSSSATLQNYVFFVLFFTLLAHNFLCVITYSLK